MFKNCNNNPTGLSHKAGPPWVSVGLGRGWGGRSQGQLPVQGPSGCFELLLPGPAQERHLLSCQISLVLKRQLPPPVYGSAGKRLLTLPPVFPLTQIKHPRRGSRCTQESACGTRRLSCLHQ